MLNHKQIVLGSGAALFVGAVIVHACGPSFPIQLLDDRAGTLLGTPSNSFSYEASHLVKPSDSLRAPDADAQDPQKAMLAGLSASQIATLTAMAKAADGDAAYAQGDGVPEAQRLYAAALVDFSKAMTNCAVNGNASTNPDSAANSAGAASAPTAHASACRPDPELLAHAASRLEAVLALPRETAAPRVIAAAAQLAEIANVRRMTCTKVAGCGSLVAEAHAAYARVRAVAATGAPDPQGLAVQSFGDEALLYLRSATTGQQCDYRSFLNQTPCAAAISAADLKRAIGLYAQQEARNSGDNSLRFIAGWALMDASRARPLIDDPVSQRLLVTYALARVGDIVKDDPGSASEYSPNGYGPSFGPSGYADAARGDASITRNPQLLALVDAIRQRGIAQVSSADRLASLAYRVGRYDLAATLVENQSSALANWVKAKLALRRGDVPAAVRAYAAASRAFPAVDPSVEKDSALLIKGEQGVLTLARGQYVEALGYLYAAASAQSPLVVEADAGDFDSNNPGYESDMSYVAERVLTTGELKTFVDMHVPASAAPGAPASDTNVTPPAPPPGDTLRYLLARRMVRDGRVVDALPYFPVDGDPRFLTGTADTSEPLKLRALAQAYAAALDEAQHAWLSTSRARGWFDAATIANQNGMELMGYEQDPDYENVGGDYYGGSGRQGPVDPDATGNSGASGVPDTPMARADAALPGPYVTADEKRRYAASESKPLKRFHYRYVAVDQATKAADLLPTRSQAFAAVLCQATGWALNDDPALARRLYRRYVKEGAYIDLGESFGDECPEPDFRAAAIFPYAQAWHNVKRHVSRHAWFAVGIALIVVGTASFGWWWYRRRKARDIRTDQR